MFDDQPINNTGATPPGNLPVGEPAFANDGLRRGEPEDMFAGVEKGSAVNPAPEAAEKSAPVPSSALSAGILRPKRSETPAVDYGVPPRQSSPDPMAAGQPSEVYKIKEPALTRGLITIVIVLVVVAILGGGGWWIYNSFIKQDSNLDTGIVPTEDVAPIINVGSAVTAPDETQPLDGAPETAVVPAEDLTAIKTASDVIDDKILFGEPVDKDGDSLDDLKEKELGTDPANWDTDNDELSDGDEVLIWQTDPLNPDSDGDSYLDGAEVKNGYNPKGPGKIFEVPKE